MTELLRRWTSPWRLALLAALCLVAGGAAAAWALTRGPSTYTVEARFASAEGVFAGAPVSVLGVRVGDVQSVQVEGPTVLVTMRVAASQVLPATVAAQLVEPELLGEPDIDLGPGYTGGPRLAAGGLIPEARTEVPASTDQLLQQLQRVLGAVRPSSAHQLVQSLAADLEGEGAQINTLLGNAASTVSLLAAKGDDLGRLDGDLATVTGALRSHETELAQLVTAYDTVSAVLASHQQQLGQAVAQLADASQALAGLLSPNLRPLEQDVAVITTVGRTLDRNLGSLDEAVSASASLFAAAHRAYDPVQNWLDLNAQLAPGMTSEVVEGLVRDRLAGVCRRVLAHHAAGLDPAALATLATCGNPSSGYFDPVLSVISDVLAGLPGGVSLPGAGASPFSAAVATIPGLTSAQRTKVAQDVSAPPASAAATKLPAAQAAHAASQLSLPSLDRAIDSVLGSLPLLYGPAVRP